MTGDAIIYGQFSRADVVTLSQQLKYGSLPLSFKIQDFSGVSATLGLQQMKMGLFAGAIGLALVIMYCLFYYRALGLVVLLSLLASGVLVFASLVLLGRFQGYTLSLAGIAGFIVAIGITADSFVVFFERLKDEVKDGRSVRSAVPRAWVRARRTILSADTVSFLAAAVLYFLALGPVKGFAFTLGLSTLIDVLVVFLFTHPLVAMLARSSAFTSPRFSGLGNVRSDKAITTSQATNRFGAVRTKES
jgi:preprotein translocase subunit SecD